MFAKCIDTILQIIERRLASATEFTAIQVVVEVGAMCGASQELPPFHQSRRIPPRRRIRPAILIHTHPIDIPGRVALEPAAEGGVVGAVADVVERDLRVKDVAAEADGVVLAGGLGDDGPAGVVDGGLAVGVVGVAFDASAWGPVHSTILAPVFAGLRRGRGARVRGCTAPRSWCCWWAVGSGASDGKQGQAHRLRWRCGVSQSLFSSPWLAQQTAAGGAGAACWMCAAEHCGPPEARVANVVWVSISASRPGERGEFRGFRSWSIVRRVWNEGPGREGLGYGTLYDPRGASGP